MANIGDMEVWHITRSYDTHRNIWNVKPESRPASLPVPFQLCDDDGEIYYQGRATCDYAVLDALDTYGSHAGCTQAQTMVDGRWTDLN